MFIVTRSNHDPRSSGAQRFPRLLSGMRWVSLLWSEENLLEDSRSINITSLRDGETC
jgi:hypothetical protein